MSDTSDTSVLLRRADTGDPQAFGELLERHRERLMRVVGFRMDPRLRSRIDPADVVQETFVEVTDRFNEYSSDPPMPFFVWLRLLTIQKLAQQHRHHLGVKARDVGREVSLYGGPLPQATSACLAAQLLGKMTSPSQAAMKIETKLRLEEKLNEMEPIDREVLALRHFEQLTNAEAAVVLEITQSACSNRYVNAVKRLRQAMKFAPRKSSES